MKVGIGKYTVTYNGLPIIITGGFLVETLKARRAQSKVSQVLKDCDSQGKIIHAVKPCLKEKEKLSIT